MIDTIENTLAEKLTNKDYSPEMAIRELVVTAYKRLLGQNGLFINRAVLETYDLMLQSNSLEEFREFFMQKIEAALAIAETRALPVSEENVTREELKRKILEVKRLFDLWRFRNPLVAQGLDRRLAA